MISKREILAALSDLDDASCRCVLEKLAESPAYDDRHIRRDEAIVEYRQIFHPEKTDYGAARAITLEISRYFRTSWKHDKQQGALHGAIQARQLMHRVLRLSPVGRDGLVPPSLATIRRALEKRDYF